VRKMNRPSPHSNVELPVSGQSPAHPERHRRKEGEESSIVQILSGARQLQLVAKLGSP
jgi:hypothetical protein